jgi:asparagine synthase (glutamine-hydrolysing)
MCGIAGFFTTTIASVQQHASSIAKTLRHRGPDDEGFLLIDPSFQPLPTSGDDSAPDVTLPHLFEPMGPHRGALVHRRLAIIDTTSAGHQPLSNHQKRHWIVFNGEVYNYRELRTELAALGHCFVTSSDTEVVLAAFVEWGDRCLERMIGMWALAIFDRDDHTLFLARDPFGIKPLFYAQIDGHFAFASEMQGLLVLPWIDRTEDPNAVHNYLVFGQTDDQSFTFYKGIKQLQAGTYATVNLHTCSSPTIKSYWKPTATPIDISFADRCVSFRRHRFFLDCVRHARDWRSFHRAAHLQLPSRRSSTLRGALD